MKFVSFIFSAFVTIPALAAVRSASTTTSAATPGLRRALLGTPTTTSTGSESSGGEICVPATSQYTQSEVKLIHDLAARLNDPSWTGLTQPGQPNPKYSLGCGFLDFKCYSCDLCKDVYEVLLETGSEVACDFACIGIVEAAGGGPEDPVADAVAAVCIPLCAAVFAVAEHGTAQTVCAAVKLCS